MTREQMVREHSYFKCLYARSNLFVLFQFCAKEFDLLYEVFGFLLLTCYFDLLRLYGYLVLLNYRLFNLIPVPE